jgi:hypothetical protein
MQRQIIHPNGKTEKLEVGNGFETWNRAIGADIGELVRTPHKFELWCDEEALCKADPQINYKASLLAGQPIVGSVIVFEPGDVK